MKTTSPNPNPSRDSAARLATDPLPAPISQPKSPLWKWLVLAAVLTPVLLSAQYSIDWYSVDGGGGTSTNGQYSISGTIGQPDAGAMIGTNASGQTFTLQGGFWGIAVAVQAAGAPYLSVLQTNNLVVVSWHTPADGWLLARTNLLTGVAAVWPPVPPPYQTNGDVISVTFPNPSALGNQFFRLYK